MMAADGNFQAHIKLMKIAVVRRAAPDCNNLCDCGRAERLIARWVCGGNGAAGWRGGHGLENQTSRANGPLPALEQTGLQVRGNKPGWLEALGRANLSQGLGTTSAR